ncbi:MAG: pirin family protein [Vicinamibacteria bacterium]
MSHASSSPGPEACASGDGAGPTLEAIPAREMSLGGLAIRRLLPAPRRRLVGAWCFLDAFGPLSFDAGRPMDVPPHPHIGLQTVSWLLDGEVLHEDSLGCEATARPGTLNLMTSGRGIAHSEETPASHSGRLEGVQLWVALPEASRRVEPSFEHHAGLPVFEAPSLQATVILGALGGLRSPGRTFSPIVGADVTVEAGAHAALPLDPAFEHAVMLLRGAGSVARAPLRPEELVYLGTGRSELSLAAKRDSPLRLLLLGGAPFGETVLMWWNFVARTAGEIREARDDWQAGRRFGEVKAYRGARLDAPPFVARPVPPSTKA